MTHEFGSIDNYCELSLAYPISTHITLCFSSNLPRTVFLSCAVRSQPLSRHSSWRSSLHYPCHTCATPHFPRRLDFTNLQRFSSHLFPYTITKFTIFNTLQTGSPQSLNEALLRPDVSMLPSQLPLMCTLSDYSKWAWYSQSRNSGEKKSSKYSA